ncbi:MAG: hypothetical protein ACK5GV_11910 [Bacteroidota bacterium]|jgi:hypothetical protein
MTPDFAYEKYLALKMHFGSSGYDYFKYSGKVKANKDSYDSRRDKSIFNKICKTYNKRDYFGLLISNFIYNSDLWIGDIISESGQKRFFEWKKRIQSIKYIFNQDLNVIEDFMLEHDLSFNDMFKRDEPYPKIVSLCIQKKITLETFLIINQILDFVPKVDKVIAERILWEKYKLLSVKYAPFIFKGTLDSYKKTLSEKFYRKKLTTDKINDTI